MSAIRLRGLWLTGVVGLAGAGAFAPGCGGSDGAIVDDPVDGSATSDARSDTTRPDVPADSSSDVTVDAPTEPPTDAQADATPDAPATDAAADALADAPSDGGSDAPADAPAEADAAPGCVTDNSACSNSGSNALCKTQVCASCTDGAGVYPSGDDANCTSAYGGASTPYLCSGGACTPGNCRTNPDCAGNVNGTLCGVAQSNQCGKCTTDAQCIAAGGGTPVCNTGTGACVASAGSCTGTADNAQCAINLTDVCCSSACTPGNCCPGANGDATCKTRLGNASATCSAGHACTTCDTVSGLTFVVDPLSGNDGSATGSGASGGGTANPACAFKTITRALQAIGSNPGVGTVIQVRNTAAVSVAGNGETFPIIVTKNVTITASGGLVTVAPPASPASHATAFVFASASSGINGTLGGGTMTIDGTANTALNGVVVSTGSTDGTTLQNVSVKNFLREGILVSSGTFSIHGGVVVTGNGTASARHSGLHINGTGHVNVVVGAGQTTTSFNGNAQHGILVDGTGSLNVFGAQAGGLGTIEAKGNSVAGVSIAQTPGVGLKLNTIGGLVVTGTTGGNGIRIEGGSNVKIRKSYSLGNAASGVVVATSVVGATRNNSLTNIDLGKVADPGNNTFQAAIGANANQAAGICLQVDALTGALSARGNLFSGGKDCATTAALLTFSATGCGSNRDLGLAATTPVGTTTGNDIDVAMCTHP